MKQTIPNLYKKVKGKDYLQWANNAGIRIWKETTPAHWGSVGDWFWCYEGPFVNNDGIGIGISGGLTPKSQGGKFSNTEEGIIKMLYQTVQSDLKELRVKQKKQKNPTPNVKYTKSQFTKAMTKYHMNGGYSFGEFTLEMSWLDFQKNTKTFDWLMPYF